VRADHGSGLLFDSPEFELWALYLLGRNSTASAMPLALLYFSYFLIGSHIFAWAGLDQDPLIYASYIVGMTGCMPPCSAFYWLRWGLTNFLPGWPQIKIFPNLFLPIIAYALSSKKLEIRPK
jgi:hypothetical protein